MVLYSTIISVRSWQKVVIRPVIRPINFKCEKTLLQSVWSSDIIFLSAYCTMGHCLTFTFDIYKVQRYIKWHAYVNLWLMSPSCSKAYHLRSSFTSNSCTFNPMSAIWVIYDPQIQFIYTNLKGMQRVLSQPHEGIFRLLVSALRSVDIDV